MKGMKVHTTKKLLGEALFGELECMLEDGSVSGWRYNYVHRNNFQLNPVIVPDWGLPEYNVQSFAIDISTPKFQKDDMRAFDREFRILRNDRFVSWQLTLSLKLRRFLTTDLTTSHFVTLITNSGNQAMLSCLLISMDILS